MSIYGAITTGADVENAVSALLVKWMPAYLGEIAVQAGKERGDLPMFRSITTSTEVAKFPEEQLPALVIVSPGLTDVPVRDMDGQVTATWQVGAAAVVSASTVEATALLVRLYVAAMRAAVLQHQSFDGFAIRTTWIDESYDEIDSDDRRSIQAGMVAFEVEAIAMYAFAGPSDPGDDPNAVNTVEDVIADVERMNA